MSSKRKLESGVSAAPTVALDPKRRWVEEETGRVKLYCPQDTDKTGVLLDVADRAEPSLSELREWTTSMRPGFAVILEHPDFVFAAVDKIRSYPVFYCERDGRCHFSNSARFLRNIFGLETLNEVGLLEMRMAGFTTGGTTVYSNLRQLQAGELGFWDRRDCTFRRERYFLYDPVAEMSGGGEHAFKAELAERTDQIFDRISRRVGKRPVWVPLSGGLDSRLVLAKLKEHGVPNLQAFSYAPHGNHEASTAREVARRLDVPWFHRQPSARAVREFFHSDERRRYWEFSDGLSTIPDMAAAPTLFRLKENGRLPSDAVLINGQSGDFITGNHLPEYLVSENAEADELLNVLVRNHLSLWEDLKTPENVMTVRERILEVLANANWPPVEGHDMASLYELWEWQERQCKYVVNGQQLYEYLSLDWELPLWDEEYLQFWKRVPIELRFRQKLYRSYLHDYDYRGLFGQQRPSFNPRATPGWLFYPVHGFAKLLEFLGGKELSRKFRSYARYIGYYRFQYCVYPLRYFLRHAVEHRNPVSFFAETWVEENLGLSPRV